ncbi:MAG: T9SS type A sorting domain-containing protein, partial [Bacteroidota bacterium]
GEDLFPNPNQDFFYDIVGTFNSNQPAFYFGLDGNPPAGQFDFVTIALHELAHGLGFIGSGLVDDGTGGRECTGVRNIGCWGYFGGNPTGFPLVFDRFVENGAGQSFLNQTLFPNPSSQLSTYFRGQDLVLGAPILQQVFGDAAPLWAPASFVVGSSFSHWDENEFRSTSAALMTPQIARGEVHRDPGDITCAFLADMGWDLGPGCRLLTTDGEASVESSPLVLRLVGPNPAATRITLELRQQTAGNATVDIVDARGRVVRVAHSGPLAADSEIAVDVSTLAAGVYWARARTPAGTRALGFAVAR